MTDDDYAVLVKAMKTTVKRIAAENTWLRHSLMEMEARVTAMATQLTQLEARAKALRKALQFAGTHTTAATTKGSTQRSKAASTDAVRIQPTTHRSKQ